MSGAVQAGYAPPTGPDRPAPGRRWLRWLLAATVAWAVLLAVLTWISVRDDPPTVREQRTLAEAGPVVDPETPVRLPAPVVHRTPDGFTAEVLTVDHFGNVQLAAPADLLDGLPARVRVAGLEAVHGRTFADAPAGALVAYADSAGRVAVAVNNGRAADVLAARPGDLLPVTGT
ncbi:hypothetical protein DLE60_24900 [Micromonospora globispora]|uniref:SAM hydroxide adenosyltransferase n=1 Tax=Micromonospora globispora TaxID=1450148 RepID=UPI000D6F6D64|nr:SAM hydroxide adenosyltransferase [Micromonospora globispora]PWU57244.1 hypothetical protein DLE60_24900 [Micromonospora globispora]